MKRDIEEVVRAMRPLFLEVARIFQEQRGVALGTGAGRGGLMGLVPKPLQIAIGQIVPSIQYTKGNIRILEAGRIVCLIETTYRIEGHPAQKHPAGAQVGDVGPVTQLTILGRKRCAGWKIISNRPPRFQFRH